MSGGCSRRADSDERIAAGCITFWAAGGCQKLLPSSCRQGGAENNHGAAKVDEFMDQRSDQCPSIDIVRMYFIEDDDFARQREPAHEEVFHCDNTLQRLVNSANAIRRKQRL